MIVAGLGVLNMCRSAVADRLDDLLPVSVTMSNRARDRATSMSSCEMGDAGSRHEKLEPLLEASNNPADGATNEDGSTEAATAAPAAPAERLSRGAKIFSSMITTLVGAGLLQVHENCE